MDTYERRPDVIRAIQWDGTIEGAMTVAKFLRNNRKMIAVKFTHRLAEKSIDSGYLEITGALSDNDVRLYSDEWIVVDEHNAVKYYRDEDFNKHYKRKK